MAMTDAEKLTMVKTLLDIDTTDISEDALIAVYLTASAREILAWRFSYGSTEVTEVPDEYEMTQIFAVVAGYSIGGAEGQTVHNENGINRTFKYTDMVAYIRAHVIPICKVV
mgnify:CR=1 FL=1